MKTLALSATIIGERNWGLGRELTYSDGTVRRQVWQYDRWVFVS